MSLRDSPRESIAAAVTCFTIALAVTAALHAPVLPHLRSTVPYGAFHGSHAWIFDHIARVLTLQEPSSLFTERLAWPAGAELRPMAIGPTLVAMPFRPLLGPLGAYNMAVLLSPSLTALATMWLLRRATDASAWTASALSLPFALCPYALGTLASGQTEKVQLWCLALPLGAAVLAMAGSGRALLGVGLAVVMTCFTEPSIGLQLPFALGAAVLLGAIARRMQPRALGMGALVLGVAAASMLPSYFFYRSITTQNAVGGALSALQPALRMNTMGDVVHSVAAPDTTFWPSPIIVKEPLDTAHLHYLPVPLVLAAVVLFPFARRGRWLGLAWVVVGLLLAFGEHLIWQRHFVRYGGMALALPAEYLARYGYPLAASGMYYRIIALAALGLVVVVAAGCARLGRWGVALAWLVSAASTAEGLRMCWSLWPRQAWVDLDKAVLDQIARDPEPGAVLDLPLENHGNATQAYLLSAALHGRPTNAVPRLMRVSELSHLRGPRDALMYGSNAASRLSTMGFRYVVWHDIQCDDKPCLDEVKLALGPPTHGEQVWLLSPEVPPDK